MQGVKLQITGSDIRQAVNRLNAWGITVYDWEITDEITAVFSIRSSCYKKAAQLVRYGFRIDILHDTRIPYLDLLRRRCVLLIGIVLLLIMTVYLPTRVLFVQVEGNDQLPERLILEKAEQCGITFGTARRSVRSERVKNQLLQLLPQLQWAGINTQGCVAVISVKERQPEENDHEEIGGIGNIVAVRDGIIQSVTVLRGSSRCKPGQAVRQGEILISGYTDCGYLIRAEDAQGEVYALTNRSVTAVLPNDLLKKGKILSEERKYSLQIGKKRINLYKDSGILDGTCDKMYSYSYVTLPGGFQLPIALIRERWICRQADPVSRDEETAERLLISFSREHLHSQMISGQILHGDISVAHYKDHCVLSGNYACSEMIGQILYEERFQENGENR